MKFSNVGTGKYIIYLSGPQKWKHLKLHNSVFHEHCSAFWMNIEFHVILDSNMVEYIQHLICEFITTWLFPILTKTNSFINGWNAQFWLIELQGSRNLIWTQTETWFNKIKKKLYWGLLLKNYKGHIIKIWESNSLSCNLVWFHEPQGSIYFPNKKF